MTLNKLRMAYLSIIVIVGETRIVEMEAAAMSPSRPCKAQLGLRLVVFSILLIVSRGL